MLWKAFLGPESGCPMMLLTAMPLDLRRVGEAAFGGQDVSPPGRSGISTTGLDGYATAFLQAVGYRASGSSLTNATRLAVVASCNACHNAASQAERGQHASFGSFEQLTPTSPAATGTSEAKRHQTGRSGKPRRGSLVHTSTGCVFRASSRIVSGCSSTSGWRSQTPWG